MKITLSELRQLVRSEIKKTKRLNEQEEKKYKLDDPLPYDIKQVVSFILEHKGNNTMTEDMPEAMEYVRWPNKRVLTELGEFSGVSIYSHEDLLQYVGFAFNIGDYFNQERVKQVLNYVKINNYKPIKKLEEKIKTIGKLKMFIYDIIYDRDDEVVKIIGSASDRNDENAKNFSEGKKRYRRF